MMNILIPTDFSENAQNAIAYALAYFSDVAVNFYILHVSHTHTSTKEEEQELFSDFDTEMQTVQSTSATLREEIRKYQIRSQNPAHSFFPLHESLNLVEAIRKNVIEKEIDYILMGTKGTTKINGGEMGSNICDGITKVKCPILVIPENAKFNGIKNIAFLTDYNCIYRNKIITRLSETLDLHRSPLRVLHIKAQNTGLTAAQTDNKGFLHYFFKDKKHSFHFVENKDLEIGIQDFVETWDISLVSIVAKNLNLIQRLLLRPAVKSMNYSVNVPFLVLHE
ncbi:MAG TPA: universal stress protein [Aequorivita sp.]|nr:universal stress protein [Aequorivita sp.]